MFTPLMFAPANFISSLKYLVVGMLSIFIVIGIIMLVTTLLNKIFSGKQDK
ncbi:MAG: OadG-related small transporter subunit [Acutalibacteraceae bacterium]|jgi:hypothetical protein